ncbi:MAG TPA: hypothetical protein VNJ53_07140, partial [Gaiellaceae bacterium]|nr:hypothetical protein [Gaiellaceae bacterium]
EPEPEPEPVALVEPEPEPEPVALEPSPPAVEPASAAWPEPPSSAPQPPSSTPEPVREPDPAAPAAERHEAAGDAVPPVPAREPEPLPDYIVVSDAPPPPPPAPEPEPEPDLSALPLPDYIVDPEHPRPRIVEPVEEDGDDPVARLSRRLASEFPPVSGSAASDGRGRPAPKMPATDRAREEAERKSRKRRSAEDPGDVAGDLSWMRQLSDRLSAYSLADDEPSANGDTPGEDEAPERPA